MSIGDARTSATALTHDRLVGTGIMAEHVRSFDWASTPLGAIEEWSDTLTSAVNQLLCTPLPATLSWGERLIFFYNDAAIVTLGAKHPVALGQSYREVFAEAWHLVEEDMYACYERGQTVVREDVLIPIAVDGVTKEQYWTYSLVPIHEGGRIAGVYDPYQNTTAAVVNAREREKADARIRQFLSATTDSVVGINRSWVITFLNAAAQKTYGLHRELVGKKLWAVFPEAVYEGSPFVTSYERAMDEGLPGSFAAHYPDPLNIWIQSEVYPTEEGIVTFSRDVTQAKQTAAALVQNEKLAAVGRLASSIAHEINNPLESVTNLLYLIRGSEDLSTIHEYVDTAERELRRVSLIANQTLGFHKQSTNASPAYCYDLIADSLAIFQSRVQNNHIHVEKRKRAEHPVSCFSGEIRQVLNNLIGNAIDSMPLGGRLLLRSREATRHRTGEKGLVITVADTGTGMSSEVQRRLFDAFYTTKGIGGSGLGLWISQDIVARHGGTMTFRSKDEGAKTGTVFNLFLPFKI